jgi:ketosteroid isomerase-like protein
LKTEVLVKRTFPLFVVVGAVFVAVAIGFRGNAASDDNAQINTLYQNFATAVRHKDLDGVMAVYQPGPSLFVFDINPPRQHVGWDNYRADWKGFFGAMSRIPSFSVQDLGVTIVGDVAYTHSIQPMTSYLGKSKSPMHANVRVTDVLRKTNGKWLIVQEHVSVPVDFNTMKADMLSKP